MSIIRAIKLRLGLSVTPANNFALTAEADNGTMKLARESGQDIMTVDAAGRVAFPQNVGGPAFSATNSVSQTGVVSGASSKVVLPVVHFDTNGCYDPNYPFYRFTPNVAGYYQINAQLYVSGTNLTVLSIELMKNSANALSSFLVIPAVTDQKLSISGLLFFNGTTDYVELFGEVTGTVINFGVGSTFSASFVRAA